MANIISTRYLKRMVVRVAAVAGIFWALTLVIQYFPGNDNLIGDVNDNNPIEYKQERAESEFVDKSIHTETEKQSQIKSLDKTVIENKDSINKIPANEQLNQQQQNIRHGESERKIEQPDVQTATRKKSENKNEDKQLEPPNLNDRRKSEQNGPGEMGHPVVINKGDLNEDQKKDFDDGWHNNAFNRYASDMISLHRSLPDVRDPECKKIDYGHNLPDACVIIIFHNEAWSVLLRTVHSVIDRSPAKYLKEVILVDDFSDFAHLQSPLQDYVDKIPKVSIVRAKERSGLIRARLMGFERCTASVAIFLDSHCEATEGWLEPLLFRIEDNNTNVLVPVIDSINDNTFEYSYSPGNQKNAPSISVGGFDWSLLFHWHPIPERDLHRLESLRTSPIRYLNGIHPTAQKLTLTLW